MVPLSRRMYNCTDAELLVAANLMYLQLQVMLFRFTAVNSNVFTQAYLAVFRSLIDKAASIGRHADVLHVVSEETAAVKKARAAAKKAYEVLAFDVETAFQNDPVRQNIFSVNSYGKYTSGKVAEFLLFMQSLVPLIEEHYPSLEAAGYNSEKRAAFIAATAALSESKTVQGDAKSSRSVRTLGRAKAMNAVYAVMVQISHAAKTAFAEEPETMALFDLPRGTKAAKKAGDEDLVKGGASKVLKGAANALPMEPDGDSGD